MRGPFKHKKAQEAFERRTHRRLLRVAGAPDAVDRFVQYVESFVLPNTQFSLRLAVLPRADALLRFSLPAERSRAVAAAEEERRLARHAAAEAKLAQLDQRAQADSKSTTAAQ